MNEAKRILNTGSVLWIIIFAALVASAYNNLSSRQTIQAMGSVTAVNVSVFSDQACTVNCTSLSWGNISPGQTKTSVVYVMNPGNVPVLLTLGVENCSPINASNVLSLNWDRQSTVLQIGKSIAATFTLAAAQATGSLVDFSFNIIITGTQE